MSSRLFGTKKITLSFLRENNSNNYFNINIDFKIIT